MKDWEWRYIVRSRDKTSGIPNNFFVNLPNSIQDTVGDLWVKIVNVSAHSFPPPSDTTSVQTMASKTGFYNQPSAPSQETWYDTNRYGFDTGAFVDVCLGDGVGTPYTLDTESGINPVYTLAANTAALTSSTTITHLLNNKTGLFVGDTATIAGVTGTMTCTTFTAGGATFSMSSQTTSNIVSGTNLLVYPAQPYKTRGDKTLVIVPYNRTATLSLPQPTGWVKLSSRNLSNLNVKLFNDKGFPLKLRKLVASASPNAVDYKDIDMDDWTLEFIVRTSNPSPLHKI